MKKEDKALLIDSLYETINNYAHFYVVDVTALNAQTTSDLRRECFKNDIKLQVVKNTLFIKALDKVGNSDFEAFKPTLKENTAIMFCNTANKPARLIKDFSKSHAGMPVLKSAYAEGMTYIGADTLNSLCALKSKNELIADVIAALESPIMNVLSALENREESAAAAE
ncbi:MAG: 50S ribosomal protein L10 [Bacteroidales bacterium]|nr:50S ribosomal protein L10 [Bacteroidales bacterium]